MQIMQEWPAVDQMWQCEKINQDRKGQQQLRNIVAWQKSTQIADEADYQWGITVLCRMMSSIWLQGGPESQLIGLDRHSDGQVCQGSPLKSFPCSQSRVVT